MLKKLELFDLFYKSLQNQSKRYKMLENKENSALGVNKS